jgi:hypothetical protein
VDSFEKKKEKNEKDNENFDYHRIAHDSVMVIPTPTLKIKKPRSTPC